jgi:hypothetical protein
MDFLSSLTKESSSAVSAWGAPFDFFEPTTMAV